MKAVATILLVCGLALVAGCGRRGAPMPPEPRGPYAPEDVEVRQIGAEIHISFDVPESRNRDKPSQEISRAFLVKVEQAGAGQVPDADSFRRRGDKAGVISLDGAADGRPAFVEALGSTGGSPAPVLWYGVRVEDRRGRSSPLVVAGRITPVQPLTVPPRPRAEMTASGVRLQWDLPPDSGDLPINIYRTVLGSAFGRKPVNDTPVTGRDYLDSAVTVGSTYSYLLRAAVSGDGPYQESGSSAAVQVHAVDLFAPAPPTRPVAVQEAAVVRLFWDPNEEKDLSGYRIYRRRGEGDWAVLQIGPVNGTSWLDRDVLPGERYAYRITALDRAKPSNESGYSEVAGILVALDPDSPVGADRD
jgi:hypothetical protein